MGLLPVAGIGKFNAALPKFSRVIVCGLSVWLSPQPVLAKVRVGGRRKSSFNTWKPFVSAM